MRNKLRCRQLAWALGLCAALSLSAAPAAHAQQCAQEALASFGPLNPFGFPAYYVDRAGQALQMCLDVNDPLCGAIGPVPNPAAPLDVATGNFLPEAPYSFVTADFPLPTSGRALLVLSVIGTWGNNTGAVINGTQTTFSRVRFRIDTPQGGLYTITYPFGVMQFNVAAGGRRSINFTTDCLVNIPTLCGQGVGNFFTTPLDPTFAHIGHFLAWNPAESTPPAGYLGNPAVLHTVIGSPCGTNFFRIEGPGLPAGGAQTNLFSVQGKKAAICGNGVLDAGEQCDDGNTLNGDCCSSTCRIDPAGTACNDGSACTTGDRCAGGTPTCVGTAVNCSDGNVCTTDSCDPVRGCQHVNNSIPCSDSNACTVGEACAGGVCVGGTAAACSDGNACTTDTCNPASGCVHTPIAGCGAPPPACVPTTCAAQAKNCGTIPDGCGGTLTCGVCTAPATCGGAGVANVCGVAGATATLTLTATGRGGERVRSIPGGLNVPTGTTASATFATGTSIRLSATNGRSVIWSGVCSSRGQRVPTCTFTLTANASETANVQ